jgi:hypothetical protein
MACSTAAQPAHRDRTTIRIVIGDHVVSGVLWEDATCRALIALSEVNFPDSFSSSVSTGNHA